MQRMDQLVTQLNEYIKRLEHEKLMHDPATDEYHLIKEELEHIEWYLTYTLSLEDEISWQAKTPGKYDSL